MAKKKILIIEDDLDTRQFLSIRLKANDYNTVLASDAISAISSAQKEKPDLIILDLGLPGGDGFEVMARLRSLKPVARIPIIVLSARDPAANKARALKEGAAAFLQKPADNDELLAAIRSQLEGELPAATAKGKILIIEDDADTRQILNIRLRANDYDTAFAGDATTAIIVAKKEKPDLIILDLGLPGGDGFMIMERLKAIACIPVIVVSARDPQVNKERALKAGAQAFFQKPADNDELLAAIRKALEEQNR